MKLSQLMIGAAAGLTLGACGSGKDNTDSERIANLEAKVAELQGAESAPVADTSEVVKTFSERVRDEGLVPAIVNSDNWGDVAGSALDKYDPTLKGRHGILGLNWDIGGIYSSLEDVLTEGVIQTGDGKGYREVYGLKNDLREVLKDPERLVQYCEILCDTALSAISRSDMMTLQAELNKAQAIFEMAQDAHFVALNEAITAAESAISISTENYTDARTTAREKQVEPKETAMLEYCRANFDSPGGIDYLTCRAAYRHFSKDPEGWEVALDYAAVKFAARLEISMPE